MLSDPQFWILVAFIIFILAVFQPIKKILISNLDVKIAEIKKSIDDQTILLFLPSFSGIFRNGTCIYKNQSGTD